MSKSPLVKSNASNSDGINYKTTFNSLISLLEQLLQQHFPDIFESKPTALTTATHSSSNPPPTSTTSKRGRPPNDSSSHTAPVSTASKRGRPSSGGGEGEAASGPAVTQVSICILLHWNTYTYNVIYNAIQYMHYILFFNMYTIVCTNVYTTYILY